MKKFYGLLSIVILIFSTSCQILDQSDGVIGYWTFDEKNGTLAFDDVTGKPDSIHYIFNHELPPSDPIRRKGISNGALMFDGFSTYIERPEEEFNTPLEAFSVSVWVAPRAFEHGDSARLSAMVNQQDINKKSGFALGMYRHGSWSFQVGTGKQWIEIWDEGHPIPRRQWSFLTATFDGPNRVVSLYLNGKKIASRSIASGNSIKPAQQPLIIGRHNQAVKLGRGRSYTLNMFNGLMDDLILYSRILDSEEVNEKYNRYLRKFNGSIPTLSYKEIKIDRSKFQGAPYRPQYHAIPPGHWMNEPHAPFFYNGKYHLTYQHNPTGPYWHQIHWGHWVSDDLVHWYDVPEAIFPDNDTVAPDGIWSGSATFDQNDIPVLVYTFGNWSKVRNQGVALAFPRDPEDPDLKEWVKHPEPTITQDPGQGIAGEFRDPFAWRDEDTGNWYLIIGSGIEGKGGTAWFYESENLFDWNLKGPFYLSNYGKYPFLGDKWELPVFLPIGKYSNGETRYILIVSPKGYLQNVEVYYWLGRFDRQNYRFIPDDEEPMYFDYGENRFIGPSGMVDPKTGRVLVFTITAGGNGPGWSGNASFPTHLFLNESGKLGVKPIEELKSLRKKSLLAIHNMSIMEANNELKNINGDMLEIILEMESNGAGKYGLKVLKSPDGREETLLFYDAVNKKLLKDDSKSRLPDPEASNNRMRRRRESTDTRTELRNHFDIEGENLRLHVFLDKALIQAYANDQKTITTWAYPRLSESRNLEVFSEAGDAMVRSMEVWEMKSIYYED